MVNELLCWMVGWLVGWLAGWFLSCKLVLIEFPSLADYARGSKTAPTSSFALASPRSNNAMYYASARQN